MIDDLARWAPTIVAALGAAAVWGRNSSKLEALSDVVGAHRDESRKRGDEHAAELRAMRSDLTSAAQRVAVADAHREGLERRIASLESDVLRLRERVHELSNRAQGAA